MEPQTIQLQLMALLERLEARRESSEERMRELGIVDPVKSITGTTALDRAIEEARQMLARLNAAVRTAEPRAKVSAGSGVFSR